MVEDARPPGEGRPAVIEPDARLVVLARTLDARDLGPERPWRGTMADSERSGGACLGRALYRHRSVFQGTSDAPVWSHLELVYFRDIVPVGALRDLVFERRSADAHLLRAEILVPTPSAFVMPLGWRGMAGRPERRASIEYIDVRPACLAAYRDVMRRSIGPAAARSVAADRIGTFRAMETAVVLHRDPSLTVDWNQIHLCEVDARSFGGFGQEFDAALRDAPPDGGFAGLGAMRTIPRWTFNDAVVEADSAVAALGSPVQSIG